MMKHYDLRFRATYHGMRVLIEACEGTEGIELHSVTPTGEPATAGAPGKARALPNGGGRVKQGGKTGKHVAGEFLRAQTPGVPFKLSAVADLFVAHGFNPSSASPIMSAMKSQGLVEPGPTHGTYVRPVAHAGTAAG